MEQAPGAGLTGEAGHARSNGPASPLFSIKMICAGEEQSVDLPIDQAMIGQLALEAEIRDMRIGELLAALIMGILTKNSLEPLLQRHPKRGAARLPQSLAQRRLDADGNDGRST
jgi:hypothetical protein